MHELTLLSDNIKCSHHIYACICLSLPGNRKEYFNQHQTIQNARGTGVHYVDSAQGC